MAQAVEIARQQMSYVERGNSQASVELLARIADYLNVSMDELVIR